MRPDGHSQAIGIPADLGIGRETVHNRLLQPSGVSSGHSRALDALGPGRTSVQVARARSVISIAGHLERVAGACPPVMSSTVRAWEKTSCGQSTMFWSWVPVLQE